MKKLAISFGTRPELIKILPVFRELVEFYGRERIILIHTGQHFELLERDLTHFKLSPDVTFSLNRSSNGLSELTGKLMLEFETFTRDCEAKKNEIVAMIAQGDTASTYISAMHSFHEKVPFFHIEAGLRTFDLMNPFPEEFYRRSISEIASFHFAPTETEFNHLIKEGIKTEDIEITGNTVIDNLIDLKRETKNCREVLITLHRRELSTTEIEEIIEYFRVLIPLSPNWNFNWVSHPNRAVNFSELEKLSNFKLLKPLSFSDLLEKYRTTGLIFTDSGGIQEEAAFLGIPCVVCRKKTEREQGIKSGVSIYFDLKITSLKKILHSFNYAELIPQNTIYGDGKSAKRIVQKISDRIP